MSKLLIASSSQAAALESKLSLELGLVNVRSSMSAPECVSTGNNVESRPTP